MFTWNLVHIQGETQTMWEKQQTSVRVSELNKPTTESRPRCVLTAGNRPPTPGNGFI